MTDSIFDQLKGLISFEYDKTKGNFLVFEQEEYYFLTLSIDQLRQLGEELIAMANEAEENDLSEGDISDWNTNPALTAEQRGGVK